MKSNVLPRLGVDGRIVEGIVTTENPDGTINIAPMGPIVDADFATFIFRPFKSSTTFKNLARTRHGVLHVSDNVELFAAAAIGMAAETKLRRDRPTVLVDACRWYAFEVTSIDASQDRTTLIADSIDCGTERQFFGFNRAQHAVIEAAILATRLHLLPAEEVLAEFMRLEIIVNKTGAAAEHRAFDLLKQYVNQNLAVTVGESAHP